MRVLTILVGMRLPVLMRLLFRNGITLYPVYLLRFLVIFQNALFSSVLTLAERKNYGKKIKAVEITSPPLFIIGHWRTGTTYLHQLIARDEQFTAPALVHTVIPDHFLFSTRYYLPIMRLTTPRTRPMDNVRMHALDPQEDEFALVKMGSDSPLVKMLFPRGREFFLRDYDRFIPEGEKLETWKKNLLTFYRKLTLLEGKPIVSKNPYHTMRVSLLAEMFPGARFIHIHRDPLVVVPSTIHMWNITARDNKMKCGWVPPSIEDVSGTYGSFLEYVADQKSKLDPGQFTEVAFEELEKDPAKELKRIYEELGLVYTDDFDAEVARFLEKNRDYRKNRYQLSGDEEKRIMSNPAFDRFFS